MKDVWENAKEKAKELRRRMGLEEEKGVEKIIKGKRKTRGIEIERDAVEWKYLEEAKRYLKLPYKESVKRAIRFWWENIKQDIEEVKKIMKKYE